METSYSLVEGVITMLVIILIAVLLKKIGILKKEDSVLFSRIVLQVTLPAVIFYALANKNFNSEYIMMAGIMAIIEIAVMLMAWFIATFLKFKPDVKGALILVSAFGMTTMLGYPIIRQVFPGNPLAMEEAVVTSGSQFTEMMSQIVLIETALPSAVLTAVFAKQYNCRPDLVSLAIMTTLVISVVSVSVLFVSLF